MAMLNLEALRWEDGGKSHILPVGQKVNQPELLFEKIEDEAIEKQLAKLAATKEQNKNTKSMTTPQKDTITYEDFSKMDIRIGTILSAEIVPKTQKLLKLEVDTGIDRRTVVSGIAEYFEPEELVGKQAAFLVNLEPRKIRGVESNGMILMAQDEGGKLRLVMPNEKVINGSEVK